MVDFVAGYFGARQQGKTTQVRALIRARNPRRLLVFDPMDQYGEHAERAASLRELGRLTLAREFRLRYVPPKGTREAMVNRFDALCALAYERGELLLVVEEMQLVTRPSWSPPSWSECTLRGAHRGVELVGISQRPAHVDGNFFSCCSVISTCRLNGANDIDTLARILMVPAARIAALRPFQFLVRDMATGEVTEGETGALMRAVGGRLRLARRRPLPKNPPPDPAA